MSYKKSGSDSFINIGWQIFSFSLWFILIFLNCIFQRVEVVHFEEVHIIIFFFAICAFASYLENFWLNQRYNDFFFSVFSVRTFIVLDFTFRPCDLFLISFLFISVCSTRYVSKFFSFFLFFLYMWTPNLSSNTCWKDYPYYPFFSKIS